MRRGLALAGRYLVLRTRVPDRPGELAKLLDLLAEERVNVVEVEHQREAVGVPVGHTGVELDAPDARPGALRAARRPARRVGLSGGAARVSGRFDELPGLIDAKLAEHARVVLVYFDAFGWRFLERHGDHPALRWCSGRALVGLLPVDDDRALDHDPLRPPARRARPLRVECLRAAAEPARHPAVVLLCGRRAVPERSSTPASPLTTSSPSRRSTGGCCRFRAMSRCRPGSRARRRAGCSCRTRPCHPFDDNGEGLASLCAALAAEERGYGTIYFGDADSLMHMAGPDASEVATLIEEHLSAIAAAPWPEGTLVLLTADHGMEGISPERTTYVNVVWPELVAASRPGRGRQAACAGGIVPRPLPARPARAAGRGRITSRRSARRCRGGAEGRGVARGGFVRAERHATR